MTQTSLLVFAIAAGFAALGGWWIMRAFARANDAAVKPRARLWALGLAGLAALATLGLYAAIGRPDLPDQPYAARLQAIKETDPTQMSADQILAVLGERARLDRRDPRPHIFTGEILAEQGRDEEAARAYEAALRRDPMSPAALMGLGRVSVRLQAGAITPQTLALFQAAAMSSPKDPTPWLYQALAATQERRYADALTLWPEVKKRLAPDDPRHAMVAAMIAEARDPPPLDARPREGEGER